MAVSQPGLTCWRLAPRPAAGPHGFQRAGALMEQDLRLLRRERRQRLLSCTAETPSQPLPDHKSAAWPPCCAACRPPLHLPCCQRWPVSVG